MLYNNKRAKLHRYFLFLIVLIIHYSNSEHITNPLKYKLPKIFETLRCQLIQRNNASYVSISLLLHLPIASFDTNIVLDIFEPNGKRKTILRSNFDSCAILAAGRHYSPIIDGALQSLFAKSNVIPSCPLKTNFNYTITEYDVNAIKLPTFIPIRSFRFGLLYRIDGRSSADVVFEGNVKKNN